MMLGTLLLFFIGLSSLSSAFFFLRAKRKNSVTKKGVFFATLGSFLMLLALCYFYYLILTDDFSCDYVRNYSSLSLPLFYKCTVLWAGEEGSLFLWLAVHHLLTLLVLHTQKIFPLKCATQNILLAILELLGVGFAILLLVKSPFLFTEGIFFDGFGLNPLLEDPWMAIHPPLIFIGYAIFAVPYSYTLASLLAKNEYPSILRPTIFWLNLGIAFLGAGIFVGGFWAYKVLGWGGYYGFDPVENSSLVPFLLGLTSLHLLLVAKRRVRVLPFAYGVIFCTFGSTLYGTFLTRSGFLGDFSVHAFGGSGGILPLFIFLMGVLLLGLLPLIYRAKNFPKGKAYHSIMSKDFLTLVGVITLLAMAILIFFGMNIPLLTFFVDKKVFVTTDFYTRTLTPLAILLTILLFLSYREKNPSKLKKILCIVFFGIGSASAFSLGVKNILSLLFAGISMMTLFLLVVQCMQKRKFSASLFAHIALAFLFFTMVTSSAAKVENSVLKIQEEAHIFSYQIKYTGVSFADKYHAKYYNFLIDGKKISSCIKLNKLGEEVAKEPAIYRTLLADVYLVPLSSTQDEIDVSVSRKSLIGILFASAMLLVSAFFLASTKYLPKSTTKGRQ